MIQQQEPRNNAFSRDMEFRTPTTKQQLVFGEIRIKGCVHQSTTLTIHRNGDWESRSLIDTSQMPFSPNVKIMVEFHQTGTSNQIPLGSSPSDWDPVELLCVDLGKSKGKTVTAKGNSSFFQRYFDQIEQHSDRRLLVRIGHQKSLFKKLFK